MCTAAWSLLSVSEGGSGQSLCAGIRCLQAGTSSDPNSTHTTCSEFCWSWLKSLGGGVFVGQSSIPLSSLPIISAAFSRLASTARSLSHSFHKLCSAPPAGDANSVSEKEKKKKIAPRRSKGAGFTVMAALPWAGGAPVPGGERGRRAAAGAAAVGAQSAGGLQGALRAQDRRHPAAVAGGPAAARQGKGWLVFCKHVWVSERALGIGAPPSLGAARYGSAAARGFDSHLSLPHICPDSPSYPLPTRARGLAVCGETTA